MIQFRWKHVQNARDYPDTAFVEVNGKYCVLQYKMHFVPQVLNMRGYDGEDLIGLAEGRDVDTEWRDVTIDLSGT